MHAENTKLRLQGYKRMTRFFCALRIQPKWQWAVRLTQEIDQENIASYIGGNKFLTLTRH
jgi:hypothetical protein